MKRKQDSQPGGKRFLSYAANEVAQLKEAGRFGVAGNYVSACRRFSAYLHTIGKKDVSFRKMTPRLMSSFENWLRLQGICRNSSSCYLRSLSAIWNKALRDNAFSAFHADKNPFAGTYRGIDKTRKRAIDIHDIRRLYALDIEGVLMAGSTRRTGQKLRQRIKRLSLARDLFLFSFCSRGLTFVDMAYLRKSDLKGGVLCYSRRKTGQRMEVRMEKPMQDILNRNCTSTAYLFPIVTEPTDPEIIYQQYRNGISLYNKSLNELGRMLGGVKLTSYVSRHSWATTARSNNMPLSVISQALGHDSMRTTEIYLKSLEGNAIDNANRSLIESIFTDESCADT